MHAIKTPFFRPSTNRTASPAPPSPAVHAHNDPSGYFAVDSVIPLSRPTSRGPLNRLTLTSRRRSPVSATPPPSSGTLTQDGSYLEALSLKLSEAVSKSLAQSTGPPTPGEIVWNGRKAPPKGRGSALGALIGSEIDAASANPHLFKAILRSLHKPLSVLLTNLSAQVLTVLSSPQFTAHPTPSVPSAAQQYAIAFAVFSAELIESLDSHNIFRLESATGTAENLRSIKEGFLSFIGRIVLPLGVSMKNELTPLIEGLEQNKVTALQSAGHPKPTANRGPVHPSIALLQSIIPLMSKTLVQCITPATTTSQTMLATLLITIIWKGLVAISHRAPTSAISPNGTNVQVSGPVVTTAHGLRKIRSSFSTTPPGTPPGTRFSIKLPPSRPPSPPGPVFPTAASDAKALYDLVKLLPPPQEGSQYALAREAVDEAFNGLAALIALLDCEMNEDLEDLDPMTADLPTVIALPVLLRIFVRGSNLDESGTKLGLSVSGLIGVPEQEYREACLSGFGCAEECGSTIAKRVLDELLQRQLVKPEDRFVRWLENRSS
ncbi:hypothetical protein Clacol_000567 [Clathrus columnatus]|uniref:Uncharacterized protein n=1 Tax=Clathrus columnatus TaxID=1419009 RepID=A0AAV4ZWQ9_9AGAM|nr:hypothetical protein Clacol_000567 [Clathrus columnatus]